MPCLPCRTLFLLLYLLVIAVALPAAAQQPFLRHFTTKDGLPSNVIYDIFHDSKGFAWFCTDQGISCYDGSRFRNYNTNEGLPDSEIFAMNEDRYGRHWIWCFNRRTCYYRDGRIYTSDNDALCRLLDKMRIDYAKTVAGGDLSWYISDGRIAGNPAAVATSGITDLSSNAYYTKPGNIGYLVNGETLYTLGQDDVSLAWKLRPYKFSALGTIGRGNLIYQAGGITGADSIYTYRLDSGIVRICRRDPVPAAFYSMKYECDTAIICLTSGGMYVYNPHRGTFRGDQRYPAHMRFNRMEVDREGNTWLSTLNDGVYMQHPRGGYVYNKANGLPEDDILSMTVLPDSAVITGYNNGSFSRIRDGQISSFSLFGSASLNRIKFAYALPDGGYLVGSDHNFYHMDARSSKVRLLSEDAIKDCAAVGNKYYVAQSGGAFLFDQGSGKKQMFWKQRTTAITTNDGKTVWLGTLSGLYRWRAGSIEKCALDPALNSNRIVRLAYAGKKHLAIATHRSGLYILSGSRLEHIGRSRGLSGDNCTALCTAPDGTIWVCTDQGLDKITAGGPAGYRVHHYSAIDGLPDAKINDVAIAGGKLLVATTEGMVVLDTAIRSAPVYRVPGVYILAAALRDTVINWPARKLVLSYRDNSLQVSYTGVFLAAGSGMRYRYVLVGGSSDTVQTRLNMINLSNLKPGAYRLLIWAGHEGLPGWSHAPAVFDFTIRPPFWLTAWFILLCAGIVVAGIAGLYTLKIRAIRKKNLEATRQQQHMAVLKMQALRSQINPHFMFNALNSIQHFYSQDEDRKANQYMSLFSRLIRKALDNSESHWLTLAQELEMQTSYLHLERMRFREAFTYEIITDPAIDPDKTMIPSMLIQPYIENAIVHGLRGLRDRQGLLSIRFALENDRLTCSITDNGTGIRMQPEQSAERRSFGMQLTRQRIDTLNALYGINITVSVTDRSEVDASLQGTLVFLQIPIRTRYE